MFRAIGMLILLWGLSHFFTNAFMAFDAMATALFVAAESAAQYSEQVIRQDM